MASAYADRGERTLGRVPERAVTRMLLVGDDPGHRIEAQRETREAWQAAREAPWEAHRAMREAGREIRQAQMQALREARQAAAEARRAAREARAGYRWRGL